MDQISGFYGKTDGNDEIPMMMIGIVTNNNDPQQMGRVQVFVPTLSEHQQQVIEDQLPWVSYVAPFGGIDERSSRGPAVEGQDVNAPYGTTSEGAVSYGMWSIPKVGARVIVIAIDNDPNQLYYIGCVFANSTPHTLPHGRYVTGVEGVEQGPEGPLSTTEQPIEPLHSNSLKAFGDHENYEWRSRGADYSAAAIAPTRLARDIESDTNDNHTGTASKVIDDRDTTITEDDGQVVGKDLTYRQGYAASKSDPTKPTNDTYHEERNKRTDRNLEPTVTSFTTPGFHSMSMDDRPENCRIRFRTTTGHQMIMDDTNERIYVSTNEGRNWIEMDSDGNVMIYSEQSISVRAEGDINMTSDSKIRMTAKDGIHMKSGAEFRLHVDERADFVYEKDFYMHVRDAEDVKSHIIFEKDLLVHNKANFDWIVDQTTEMLFKDEVDIHCNANVRWTTDQNVHIHVDQNMLTTVTNNLDVDIGVNTTFTTGSNYNVNVGANTVFTTGANLDINTSSNTTVSSGGTHTIKSSNFNVDSGGNINCTGGLHATGGDVCSNSISLNSHVHDYDRHISGVGNVPTLSRGPQGGGSVGSSPATASTASTATPADPATDAQEAQMAYEAFWTLLTPSHEPWGRNFQSNTDNDAVTMDVSSKNDHERLELDNNSPNVGKNLRLDFNLDPSVVPNDLSRKDDRDRNPLWHR